MTNDKKDDKVARGMAAGVAGGAGVGLVFGPAQALWWVQ